jgi:hypothetical protein
MTVRGGPHSRVGRYVWGEEDREKYLELLVQIVAMDDELFSSETSRSRPVWWRGEPLALEREVRMPG